MKRFFLLLILTGLLGFSSSAQYYKSAVGVRVGFFNGITFKHFISDLSALEGVVDIRWQGYNVSVLYQKHNYIKGADRLSWYYGFGAHTGYWSGADDYWGPDDDDYFVLGVDGVVGLDYSFEAIPINLSLDWRPMINIIGAGTFYASGGGLAIRYYF